MGLGGVMQAAGAMVRAEGEFNLLKNEGYKRVSVDSTLARARGDELGGRSREADESNKKVVDTFYQKKSADLAAQAAQLGFISSLITVGTSIGQGLSKGDVFGAIVGGINSGFAALGAYFAMVGANEERDLVNQQFGKLSKGAEEDQENMRALDSNAFI